MNTYYSQNKEDLIIKGFLGNKRTGFYIDVGANDPTLDSVTKLFYDEGWTGINIEPIPRIYEKIKKARSRDINLNIGLGSSNTQIEFREFLNGDGLSTFDSKMKKNDKFSHKDYTVKVRTLNSIIEEFAPNKRIDFLKIDVEGYEEEVLNGINLKKHRPTLICIEANHIGEKDWRGKITDNRYIEAFFDGVNKYYIAEESKDIIKKFDYPSAVLSGNPMSIRSYLDIESELIKPLEETMKKKETELEELRKKYSHLVELQKDISYLLKNAAKQTPLKIKSILHVKR